MRYVKALRYNRIENGYIDIDIIMNRMMAGWQPVEHDFSSNLIDQLLFTNGTPPTGLMAKHHSKMTKVIINLYHLKPSILFLKAQLTTFLAEVYLNIWLFYFWTHEEMFYTSSVTTGVLMILKRQAG